MSLEAICAMDVQSLALPETHLWLWTTNQHIESGFQVMRAWGFKYLSAIHVIKPSGVGNYFVQRTQTILFGYNEKCKFPLGRYRPNILEVPGPAKHSQKWDESYDLIEAISPEPRLELFARRRVRDWYIWGNEVLSDVKVSTDGESETEELPV